MKLCLGSEPDNRGTRFFGTKSKRGTLPKKYESQSKPYEPFEGLVNCDQLDQKTLWIDPPEVSTAKPLIPLGALSFSFESQSKPIGTKMVNPEPCKELERRMSATISGWDCPLLTVIYPGVDCGSYGGRLSTSGVLSLLWMDKIHLAPPGNHDAMIVRGYLQGNHYSRAS